MFEQNTDRRWIQAFIIYLSLLLDNFLLTVIVPILPDYLNQLKNSTSTLDTSFIFKSFKLQYSANFFAKNFSDSTIFNVTDLQYAKAADNQLRPLDLADENISIGVLLATKALVQLAISPVVGNLTIKLGYSIPVIFGTFCLFIASIVFAIGSSYNTLLFARSLQGIASACIGICGMSLIAQLYPDEEKRSKIMGVVLGSIALGVLLGYPCGGILYNFYGKSAPFYILGVLIACLLIFQLVYMELRNSTCDETVMLSVHDAKKCWILLSDNIILKIAIAILISTSGMAVLEPCLPIWLMQNLNAKKWQIGMVFIPDSLGYFIGTNLFGSIAYRIGQIKISAISLFVVGVSCILIPIAASSFILLTIPHFALGLGIGTLDAALVPLMASLVDLKFRNDESTSNNYGLVYAVQQISVSLAYSISPILGSETARYLGFNWLMFAMGSINLAYGFSFYMLHRKIYRQCSENSEILLNDLLQSENSANYKRFYNATTEIP